MNKPASYFARLRRRKASPKSVKRNDIVRDQDITRVRPRSTVTTAGVVREAELANEF